MRGQSHLIVSEVWLPMGRDYEALCGKEIISAVWVFESVEEGEIADRQTTCPHCWAELRFDNDEPEYVYGAVSREEAEREIGEGAA